MASISRSKTGLMLLQISCCLSYKQLTAYMGHSAIVMPNIYKEVDQDGKNPDQIYKQYGGSCRCSAPGPPCNCHAGGGTDIGDYAQYRSCAIRSCVPIVGGTHICKRRKAIDAKSVYNYSTTQGVSSFWPQGSIDIGRLLDFEPHAYMPKHRALIVAQATHNCTRTRGASMLWPYGYMKQARAGTAVLDPYVCACKDTFSCDDKPCAPIHAERTQMSRLHRYMSKQRADIVAPTLMYINAHTQGASRYGSQGYIEPNRAITEAIAPYVCTCKHTCIYMPHGDMHEEQNRKSLPETTTI